MIPVEPEKNVPGYVRVATSEVEAVHPELELYVSTLSSHKVAQVCRTMRPEVRAAFEATLARHLPAYKYLAK